MKNIEIGNGNILEQLEIIVSEVDYQDIPEDMVGEERLILEKTNKETLQKTQETICVALKDFIFSEFPEDADGILQQIQDRVEGKSSSKESQDYRTELGNGKIQMSTGVGTKYGQYYLNLWFTTTTDPKQNFNLILDLKPNSGYGIQLNQVQGSAFEKQSSINWGENAHIHNKKGSDNEEMHRRTPLTPEQLTEWFEKSGMTKEFLPKLSKGLELENLRLNAENSEISQTVGGVSEDTENIIQ
jgi:hypothetical protein